MSLTPVAAAWFLVFLTPLCLHTAYSDMKYMKIRDWNVQSMAMVYLVLGPFLLPIETYLWHLGHLPIVLVIGMVLNAAGVMGAGDAKFIAAASPFVALGHLSGVMVLLALALLAGFLVHRGAKNSPIRSLVPDWHSWEAGKKFPMGLPLSVTLLIYLASLAFGYLPTPA